MCRHRLAVKKYELGLRSRTICSLIFYYGTCDLCASVAGIAVEKRIFQRCYPSDHSSVFRLYVIATLERSSVLVVDENGVRLDVVPISIPIWAGE